MIKFKKSNFAQSSKINNMKKFHKILNYKTFLQIKSMIII